MTSSDVNIEKNETAPGADHQAQFVGVDDWSVAAVISLLLGLLYVILSGDVPAAPLPTRSFGAAGSNRLFFLTWAPVTTWAILGFLAATDSRTDRRRYYAYSALAVLGTAILIALAAYGKPDEALVLVAMHQPFAYWAVLSLAVVLGLPEPREQLFHFALKSLDVLLTAGLFFTVGAIFISLTYGMIAATGLVSVPVNTWAIIWSAGMGLLPVPAVAAVYDPAVSPAEQNHTTSFIKLLRILSRIMLPLILAAITIFVFFFMRTDFSLAFQQREGLLVYSLTIFAAVLLMMLSIPGDDKELSDRPSRVPRYIALAVTAFSLAINLYSLAAAVGPAWAGGLKSGPLALVGWNIVAIFALVTAAYSLLAADTQAWPGHFRSSVTRYFLVPAIAWTFWVVLGISTIFSVN